MELMHQEADLAKCQEECAVLKATFKNLDERNESLSATLTAKSVALDRTEAHLRESQIALSELEREMRVASLSGEEHHKLLNQELKNNEDLRGYLQAVQGEMLVLRKHISNFESEKKQIDAEHDKAQRLKDKELHEAVAKLQASEAELADVKVNHAEALQRFLVEKSDLEDR